MQTCTGQQAFIACSMVSQDSITLPSHNHSSIHPAYYNNPNSKKMLAETSSWHVMAAKIN
jgi:hypothetical protein